MENVNTLAHRSLLYAVLYHDSDAIDINNSLLKELPMTPTYSVARDVFKLLQQLFLFDQKLYSKFKNKCYEILHLSIGPPFFIQHASNLSICQMPLYLPNSVLHDTIDLYTDIEGEFSNPVEVTILVAYRHIIYKYLHVYGVPTQSDFGGAKYCHGLFHRSSQALHPNQLRNRINEFLASFQFPQNIYCNGTEDM